MISSYQSAIRDPNTIEAWRQCMVSRTSDPSVVAYGYRDAGGNPYLTVMWLPGRALAAIAPQIDVSFVAPDANVLVDGASQPVTLAAGSGKAFALRFKTPDAHARYQGFAVLVNASARDGTRHLMDFQEQAAVPGVVGEVPCDLLIQAGREYGFLIYAPAFMTAEVTSNLMNFMVLQVTDLLPGSIGGRREFNAQASFSAEAAQKMIAMSHNNPKTILRASHVSKAWLETQGSTLTLRLEKSISQPGVLGDPALGRCTLNAAEGSVPGDRIAMKFRITGRP